MQNSFHLQLQLFTARTAVARHDQAAYRSSLAAARQWLVEFFDPAASSTQALLREIQMLEAVDIDPRLPEISRSTEALQAAFEIARGRAEETRQRLALMEKGARREQVDQARARLQLAEASQALAQTRLGYAELTAPLDGVVLTENVEPGEFVAAGTPVVTIGALDPVWLRAYIGETDLGRVKLGQTARVSTDTWPGKAYRGTVTFIAQDAEFTPKNVQTEKERVKLVYRIKITIPNLDQELKPGMPADDVIDLAVN